MLSLVDNPEEELPREKEKPQSVAQQGHKGWCVSRFLFLQTLLLWSLIVCRELPFGENQIIFFFRGAD